MSAREHRIATIRRARYYVLGDLPAADVWIAAHGHSQLARTFVRYLASIAEPGRAIVAPEALNRYYVKPGTIGSRDDAVVGATWMTREDREHEIRDYVDYLDAVHAQVTVGSARITALGFSQGVATVARWIALGSSRVDRFVAWAGRIPPDLDLARLRAVVPKVIMVVGDRDQYAEWINGPDGASRLEAAGIEVEIIGFPGGHRLDRTVLGQLAGCDPAAP